MGKNQLGKKIKEAVKILPEIAKKEGWVLTLDRDEGAFFYSPEVIPSGTELFQFADEYSVYLDEKFKPRGLMIEAYSVNFIKHNEGIKGISKQVFVHKGKLIERVDPSRNKQAQLLREMLENKILADALRTMTT